MRITVLFLLSLMLIACSPQPDEGVVRLQGKTMGTFWNVTLVKSENNTQHVDKEAIELLIKEELLLINQQFSTYLPDSEVSRFNATQNTQPFPVSQAVVDVINAAHQLSHQTQGAFDITVGPLINLWGFGKEILFEKPSPSSIQQAKANTGFQYLKIEQNPPRLIKKVPLLNIDLSAIAKGYGVDRLAAVIESQGIKNYLVEIGGELKVKGLNPRSESWKIAIEKPTVNDVGSDIASKENSKKIVQEIISLNNSAVATSGDYRNYYNENGVRYSHTIDPKTGSPIAHQLASVTVLHSSAMMADGLATAIMVLGEKKGLAFAKQHNLFIFMLIRSGDGFRVVSTFKHLNQESSNP